MSLVRAFTTRKASAPPVSTGPQRSISTRSFAPGTLRDRISAPIELVSTTNMLSYNAPDLYPSASSSTSGDESDVPALAHSPESTPDSSSAGSSPSSPVEPNHLSAYFPSSPGSKSTKSTSSNEDAPRIPSRALSHTKRSHEIIHRQRSISRLSVQRKPGVTTFARDSIHMFSANPEAADMHPFGNELPQVTEMAEEYDVHQPLQVINEEEQELMDLGLYKFGAEDYANEIAGWFNYAFPKPQGIWI